MTDTPQSIDRRTVLKATAGLVGAVAGASAGASAGPGANSLYIGDCAELTTTTYPYYVACPTALQLGTKYPGAQGTILDLCRDDSGVTWARIDWGGAQTTSWVEYLDLEPC